MDLEDKLDIEVQKILKVYKSIALSQTGFKTKDDYLHYKRVNLDTFIFNSLRDLYGNQLQNFWNKTDTIPFKSDKAIVIVERRCHPNLEFVLQCAAYFARGYTIHIFCSEANLEFVRLICKKQDANIHYHLTFQTIGTPEQGKIEYNNLLKMKSFWDLFTEEHILMMETDCYLQRPIPDSIYKFDYVASAWPWLALEAGGGGLSYRKTSAMKQICALDDFVGINYPMQDNFISNGIKEIGAKFSHDYFTECSFSYKSIGTHQWWTFFEYDEENEGLYSQIKYYLTLRVE